MEDALQEYQHHRMMTPKGEKCVMKPPIYLHALLGKLPSVVRELTLACSKPTPRKDFKANLLLCQHLLSAPPPNLITLIAYKAYNPAACKICHCLFSTEDSREATMLAPIKQSVILKLHTIRICPLCLLRVACCTENTQTLILTSAKET